MRRRTAVRVDSDPNTFVRKQCLVPTVSLFVSQSESLSFRKALRAFFKPNIAGGNLRVQLIFFVDSCFPFILQ